MFSKAAGLHTIIFNLELIPPHVNTPIPLYPLLSFLFKKLKGGDLVGRKKAVKYKLVPLDIPLHAEIKLYVARGSKFRSLTHFVNEACLEKLEKEGLHGQETHR